MGRFVTGVTIITTTSAEGHLGMTVNSLTSVSLDPCLLLVCLKQNSVTGSAIVRLGSFAINLLAGDQEELARRFARPGDNRFRDLELIRGPRDLPLIAGCAAHIVCDLSKVVEAGDHQIFLGEVLSAVHEVGIEPLAFRGGIFGVYHAHQMSPIQSGFSRAALGRTAEAYDNGVKQATDVKPT